MTECPRVLVTGATGTVGVPLVRWLAERDVTVRAASRDPARARERVPEADEYVVLDLSHETTWEDALEGVDRLFVLLPPGGRVGRVEAFADAADRAGIARVAYLSILGANRLPILPHRRIERHLAGTGMAHTFLRAAYVAQNLTGVHRPEFVERDELFVPAGRGRLSFVDARDVAAVAGRVLVEEGHGGNALDVTGPEALDFGAVARIASEELDRQITYANPSLVAFARRMRTRGVDRGLVAVMAAEYSLARVGVGARTADDARAVLDRPRRTVREFLRDHADTLTARADERLPTDVATDP